MPTIIEITAYRFEELTDQAKEKARNWFREGIDSSDSIKEHYQYSLEEMGYPADNICFSLGYCQGDGMAFYGRICLETFFQKRLNCGESVPEFRLLAKDSAALTNLRKNIGDDLELFTCRICRNCCRYCHFNTMTVSVDFDTSPEDSVRLECLATELEQWLSRDVINVSKLLEKAGYAISEYDTADEQVAETICANDYLFTEKGSRSWVL
jgi:hypothetical protein